MFSPPGEARPAGSGPKAVPTPSVALGPAASPHLGTYQEFVILGLASELPNRNLWAWGSALCVSIRVQVTQRALELENLWLTYATFQARSPGLRGMARGAVGDSRATPVRAASAISLLGQQGWGWRKHTAELPAACGREVAPHGGTGTGLGQQAC